jgi:hypothetical protein
VLLWVGMSRGVAFAGGLWRRFVVSLDKMLDDHEVVVRAEVDRLQEQLARVSAQLGAARESLSHVEITRATLQLVTAAVVVPVSVGVSVPEQGPLVSVRAPVPVRRVGMAPAESLPSSYRPLWTVLYAAGAGGIDCRQVAVALGTSQGKSSLDSIRLRLKRLVERGWAGEPGAGRFVAVTDA